MNELTSSVIVASLRLAGGVSDICACPLWVLVSAPTHPAALDSQMVGLCFYAN